jgi:hypothetical protein
MLVFSENDGQIWQLGLDLTTWTVLPSGGGGGSFASLTGQPTDNVNLAAALGALVAKAGAIMTGLLQNSNGIMVGEDNDPTRVSIPERNQFGAVVTEPFNVGDNSWTNLSLYTVFNFSTQVSLPFAAIVLNPAALTDPGMSTNLTQLIGGGSTSWHQGSGHVDDVIAAPFSVQNTNSGTVNRGIGMMAVYCNHGAGLIVNGYGLLVESPSRDGSNNNITNGYGVYIEPQNRGTNTWSFFAAGPEPAHFGGPVDALSFTGSGAGLTSIPLSAVVNLVTSLAALQPHTAALDAVSGTNTGDQDLSGLVLKTTTINGHSLSGNVTVTTADVGAEPALGNPLVDGYLVASTAAGSRSWVPPGGGGGVSKSFVTAMAVAMG